MSEEGQAGNANEAELREARELGWADKDEWRGDPATWVDATTFLERGRSVLPIVQQNNKRLMAEVGQLRSHVAASQEALRAATAAIEALEESRAADVAEQVEAARQELKSQLAEASREGDHEQVAELTMKMTELNKADKDAGGKGDKRSKGDPAQGRPQLDPEVVSWLDENKEFASDRRRVALANVIAVELREAGDTSVGKTFMNKVAEEVHKQLGISSRAGGASKVDSGGGGNGRTGASGEAGKTYADLPKEAKDACDRMASRVVGPNRAHKDVQSWQRSYVKQFFS